MSHHPRTDRGDDGLFPYCTDRQAQILQAIIDHGSQKAAARALGIRHSYVQSTMAAVRKRANLQGYNPDHDLTHPAPEGFTVKGVSTLYDESGKRLQWVKTTQDDEAREQAFLAAVEAFKEEIPRDPPLQAPPPQGLRDDLLNEVVIADLHQNMLSWHEETGANWDMEIAESVIVECFRHLIAQMPAACSFNLVDLGDWDHFDSLLPITNASGHVLDADTRLPAAVRAKIRIKRRLITLSLQTHGQVNVYEQEGNHNNHAVIRDREWLATLYEEEPRVTVDTSPRTYQAHQHGKTMLFYHHGDKVKFSQFAGIAAAQFPKMWGDTEYRYGHSGHLHHEKLQEFPGMIVRQHPTVAPPDAWAARQGMGGQRGAIGTTYHTKYGDVGSVRVRPEMVSEAA